ncbi:MAG: RsmB/NOP family class I SAM-dependent RNA methyltransferase [Candidatus Omnitrophota bacterium]
MKETVYKLPDEFLKRLRLIYPAFDRQICSTFLVKKEQTFRINYLKTDLRSLKGYLNRERIRYSELVWPKGAFVLKSDLKALQRSLIYKEGLVYVQNVSSMIPPLILEPAAEDKILDLCAAPGAKTTQIVSLAGESAFSQRGLSDMTPEEKNSQIKALLDKQFELVAFEKIRVRYYKLLANLKIQGADFITPLLCDGIWARKKYPDYFDKILLDTPCSGEGRFYINNPRSFKYWKYRKVKEMAHKQKKLIASAFRALGSGGILVYSTCTFSPEENEEIVDWALNKFKDGIELRPINLSLKNTLAGLISWRGKKFSAALTMACRIIPTSFMEGFFIAKLKKIS